MDDGSWLAAVIFPPVILIAGICGVIILIGLLFAFNQIVGLMISGMLARFRAAKISQLRETSGSRSDRSRRYPESVTDSPEAWRAIIAALRDDDVRAVLGETASAPLSPRRRARAQKRLQALGLLDVDVDGIRFDDAPLRALLATAPRPQGPERFLDRDGRIDRYPSQAGERASLLRFVSERALSPGAIMDEREVNERLEPYAPNGDVAALRRYLVDHGILERTRSGSEYTLARE